METITIDISNKNVLCGSDTPNNIQEYHYTSPINGLYYDRINAKSYKLISAFRRPYMDEIMFSWKYGNGWCMDQKVKESILRNAVSELGSFDTIIEIPSISTVNKEITDSLCEIIPHTNHVYEYFLGMYKSAAVETVNVDMLKSDGLDVKKFFKDLEKWFDTMPTEYFQYRHIPPKYRKYFDKEKAVPEESVLEYAEMINNKRVIVIDDTISTGKSITDYCKAVVQSFTPKELIIFTAFFTTNKKVIKEIKS